jgi:MYXO-CTERM domain-containing protein
LSAFRDGWAIGNGIDVGDGDLTTWTQGDLNRDGTTDASDYSLLRAGLGDFNHDNLVNAADYTIWRNSLNQAIALPNSATYTLTTGDYANWKANYGLDIPTLNELVGAIGATEGDLSPQGVASGGDVPEPTSAALAIFSLALLASRRCRRARG